MKSVLLLFLVLIPFVSHADSFWTKGDYACWGLGPAGIVMLKYDDATTKLTVTNGFITSEMQGEPIFFNAERLGEFPATRIWGEKTPVQIEINFMPPMLGNFSDGRPTTLYGTASIPLGLAIPNVMPVIPFSAPMNFPLIPVRIGAIPLFNVKCIASFVNSDISKRPKANCAKGLVAGIE